MLKELSTDAKWLGGIIITATLAMMTLSMTLAGNLNARLDDINRNMDARFNDINRRFDDINRNMDTRFSEAAAERKLIRDALVQMDERLRTVEITLGPEPPAN